MLTRSLPFFLALCILGSIAGSAHGQGRSSAKSRSFYSSIGFGIPADVYSPETMGIGLPGVSTYSGVSPNIANPGQWGLISFTQGNIALGLDTYKSADNFASSRNTFFGLESFQFAFPLLRNKLGLSLAFTPLVRSDYKKRENGFIDPLPGLNQGEVEYAVSTVGSGGVNRFEIGLGFQPVNNISVGYAFSANLLSIDNDVTPVFSDLQYTPSPYEVSIGGYEFGHRFGMYAYKANLFKDEDQISFGAAVTLPLSIDAERSVTMYRTVNGARTLVEINSQDQNRNGTVKLPLEFNTGLTYNFSRLSNIVAELQLQNWGDAKFTFDPAQQQFYKDRTRVGLGFQYHPYRMNRDGFFSNFKYSVGTTYDNGHLAIQGQDIETLFLHGGIGLTSRRSASSIDLSFHYGIRGTDSSNLVKENIWGFKLSLNLAEFMFVQQKFN